MEAIRLYAEGGRFEAMGYASPLVHPNKTHTNNYAIKNFVDTVGHHLFSIMHMEQPQVMAWPRIPFIRMPAISVLD